MKLTDKQTDAILNAIALLDAHKHSFYTLKDDTINELMSIVFSDEAIEEVIMERKNAKAKS